MGLLLKSQSHTTLVQLATGFGKSLMLALLGKYFNKTTGKKVIILVPSVFLHAYQ
jgi:ERCC4-related helicase